MNEKKIIYVSGIEKKYKKRREKMKIMENV